jgi:hypothetical protein
MFFRWIIGCLVISCAATVDAQEIKFVDVTEQAGLVEPLAGLMGHGGAWGDYDNDGRIDLLVGGFCDRPDAEYRPAAGPVANRLLRNLGDGRFDPAKMPAVEIHARTSGAVFADLDNDGDVDLYVANNAKAGGRASREAIQAAAKQVRSKLYRNDGGQLIDVSEASGACPDSLYSVRNVGVLDYDSDGRLDLFLVEDRFTKTPQSRLMKNVGELRFKDVTAGAGLANVFGLGLAIADLNDDGRPDLFVGHSNRFFVSGPDGKYRESAALRKTFAWAPLDGEDWPCGAAFGDLNRDGRLDLVLAIHGVRARNRVYFNEGVAADLVPRFRDVTAEVGLPGEVPAKCPHVEIQDFDNDGWPDIYFSAAKMDAEGRVRPLVYRNTGRAADGLPRFASPFDLTESMVYFPAGPSGDFDRDGRVDLFLVNWFQGNRSRLLHNESESGNHWLQVQVVGRKANRLGIGAKVRVYQAGRIREREALLGYQEMATGYGYASGQEAVAHFGLGKSERVDVVVTLPGGQTVEQKGVTSRQRIVVKEP